MADERRAIHCRVSPETYDTWKTFTTRNGITLTGLLEAIGSEMLRVLNEGEMEPIEREIIEHARAIDAERRRRS